MRPEPSRRTARRLGVVFSTLVVGATVLPAGGAEAAAPRAADNGARIVAFKWVDRAKTTFDITVRSRALGAKRKVRVLVPKGWKPRGRTWPTVYAFHGGRDNYTSWTRSTDIEKLARRWRAMVVMPEGANGSYTNWFNDGRWGRPKWETFHTLEVRQLVERNYRAGVRRATMGLSSGGQGACTYPGRHPGMYLYAACFSGVLSMTAPGIPKLLMLTADGAVDRPERIWGDYDNPAHRPNWDAHDPIKLLPKMRRTKFYISSGTTGQRGPLDPPGKPPWDIGYISERAIGPTNQLFLNEARRLGVQVKAHIYGNGSHSWAYWRREMRLAWPQMMKTLGARRG